LLDKQDIIRIIRAIRKNFVLDSNLEITLEANPDNLTAKYAEGLAEAGINRVSIGIQSFNTGCLEYLDRIHNTDQAIQSVINIKNAGIRNISIDLIYGIPGMSEKIWLNDIETFLSLDIPHLSAYALTVEPQTALDIFIRKGKRKGLDEDQQISQFYSMIDILEKKNYIQYEISSFARNEFFSRHNIKYWKDEKYLGVGSSAHSFNGNQRRWNISGIGSYIELLNQGGNYYTIENLSITSRFNEYVMTSLRTVWGVDIEYVKDHFGEQYADHLVRSAKRNESLQKVIISGQKLKVTKRGKLFIDGLTADLFL